MRDESDLPSDGFIVIGHRGAAGRAPENTLASFRYAWAAGVRAVELDVQRLQDELLVMHDDTLDRTTNANGKLTSYSLAQIRTLNAGSGEGIPTLSQVLAAAPANTLVNVELKGANTATLVAAEVKRWPNLRFVVSSFDLRELARFDDLQANVAGPTAIAPLFHYWRNVLKRAERFRERGVSVNIGNAIATKDHVKMLSSAGWNVWVYTVNDIERARQLRSWGVSGVFCDVPDLLLELEI